MKEKVYIETSVISYLCSRPSRDLIVAASQEITHEWWEKERLHYDCFVSEFVVQEAVAGDPDAVVKRQSVIAHLSELDVDMTVADVASELLLRTAFPQKVADDISHIAVAAVYGMDYLLTWNCKHIANPRWLPKITAVLDELGYKAPVICTPQALLEGEQP